jgi:hypothetical protein
MLDDLDHLRERVATAEEYDDYETQESSPALGALAEVLEAFTPQQRFMLSLMIFLDVLIIGCMCLIGSGRLQF